MKQILSDPVILFSALLFILLISVIYWGVRVTKLEKQANAKAKQSPLFDEDLSLMNNRRKKYDANERKLDNLLTEEEEKFINKYYESTGNSKP